MKNLKVAGLIALAFMAFMTLIASKVVQADPSPMDDLGMLPPPVGGSAVSLEQATKQLISSNNVSRVLSARTEEIEGRRVHIIKMLTKDGRIQQQTIAADSGALLDINSH